MTEPNFQLTPNEVRGQQFGTSFRGFDRMEVESFRDRVAEELDRLLRERIQLDERTRAALNVPVEVRIQQLQATLTRWNWLPRDPGPRHLWINVVTGTLDVIDRRETVLQMRVIAGHPSRPTPS